MLCSVGAELARAFDDAAREAFAARAGLSDLRVSEQRRHERMADARTRHKNLGRLVLDHKINCPDCGTLDSEIRRRALRQAFLEEDDIDE